MTTRELYEWLCASPLLENEKVNLDYLPSYEGWSLSTPRTKTSTDILGDTWETTEITITYRKSVAGNADRLAIIDMMDNLRFWAKQNPPDGCRVILAGMSKPKSKSASGTEDFILTLRLEE